MQVLNLCGRAVLKIIVGVLGISLVVYAWYKFPNAIVSMLDFNLAAIKAGCKLVPAPYGAMAESALRGMLAADKAMLFAEGTLVVKGFLLALRSVFPSMKKSPKLAATSR